MQLPIILQKNYTQNSDGYQLKLPLNLETIIPEDERAKTLSVTKAFDKYRKEDLDRLVSEEGVLLRVNWSIQVEGSFGELKQDM